MIRESQEDFLATLKSHAPDPKKPLASMRKDLSAFYAGMQEETVLGSDHHLESVAIRDGLHGIWISLPDSLTERVVLFFHGGGFTTGSTDSHLGLCIRLARASRAVGIHGKVIGSRREAVGEAPVGAVDAARIRQAGQ